MIERAGDSRYLAYLGATSKSFSQKIATLIADCLLDHDHFLKWGQGLTLLGENVEYDWNFT